MTGDALPRLLVLDDREGLVRSAPGTAALREQFRVTVLDHNGSGRRRRRGDSTT